MGLSKMNTQKNLLWTGAWRGGVAGLVASEVALGILAIATLEHYGLIIFAVGQLMC